MHLKATNAQAASKTLSWTTQKSVIANATKCTSTTITGSIAKSATPTALLVKEPMQINAIRVK